MKKPKVLIADDDRNFRAALGIRLASWGCHIVESADGLGVVDQCLRQDVDVILLDHEMPNGDGRSIARMIRNESDVPIVLLSGHDPESFRATVCDLDDVYFLHKPVDHGQLRRLLAATTRLSVVVDPDKEGALP